MKASLSDVTKRVLDLAIVLVTIPVVVPALALAAVLIVLESGRPVLFRQTRVGRFGRRFTLLKLRTMVVGAESMGAGLYAEPNDARFTRIGLWLRRFSLDEVPQLWNVCRGEMSVVGPRPMPSVVVEQYSEAYERILRVRPGMTGLAQVSGRNDLPRTERLKLDEYYVQNWTVGFDLRILGRTLPSLVRGQGQRNDQGASDVEQ